jgi:hypothetical protein
MAASFAVMNQPSGAESSSASSLTGYDVIHLYVMIFTKLSQQTSDRVAPVVDGFRTRLLSKTRNKICASLHKLFGNRVLNLELPALPGPYP